MYARLMFAKIYGDVGEDFLDRLNKGINETKVRAKRPYRRGFLFSNKDHDSLFIRYYEEELAEYTILDEDNVHPTKEKQLNANFKELFIFQNKYLLIETSIRPFFLKEITEALENAWNKVKKSNEPKLQIKRESFSEKFMKIFYKEKELKFIKIYAVGKLPPNPTPLEKEIKKMVDGVAEHTDRMSLNSIREGNLNKPDFLKALFRVSDIHSVKGLDEDRLRFTISKKGKVTLSVSEEDDRRREKVVKVFLKVFKELEKVK